MLNNSFISNIYVGDDGKLHKVQGGADSVLPFKSGAETQTYIYKQNYEGNSRLIKIPCDFNEVYAVFAFGNRSEYAWCYNRPSVMLNGSLNPNLSTSANVSLDTTNHILTFGYIHSYGAGNGEPNGHTIYIIGA